MPMTQTLGRIVDSAAFQRGVLVLILLAAVLVGLETDRALMARHGALLHGLDRLVVGLFTVELILRLARHGRRWYRFFADPWNLFDFVIVAICYLPAGGPQAAVLRLVRVLRALRLVTALPKLQLLVGALLKSLPGMAYIGLLLSLLFYVYAVVGVFLWRDNDPAHFRDLPTALLTLFSVVTLEGWTEIMYTQMYGSDAVGLANPTGLPVQPAARPVLAAAYFVSFVLLGTMIMLNLFIGVIVSSMSEAQAERDRLLARIAPPGDELAELERQLDALRERVQRLRTREATARGPAKP